MIPKGQRFKLGDSQLRDFYRSGRRVFSDSLRCVYIKSESFKMAAVVTKKQEKTAVGRNLARRRIYSAAQKLGFSSLPIAVVFNIKDKSVLSKLPSAYNKIEQSLNEIKNTIEKQLALKGKNTNEVST